MMFGLLPVISGMASRFEPTYDGYLMLEGIVVESTEGVNIFPVAQNSLSSSPSLGPNPTIFGMAIQETPPINGFMLSAMTNVFANEPPATTTIDIVEDFSTFGATWVQTSPVTTVGNRLGVAYSLDTPQTAAQAVLYNLPDTTRKDSVGVMVYYKVNVGSVDFVGATRPVPVFGKEIFVNISFAPVGSWAIVTLQHQYAIQTPEGWVIDVGGTINGDHPETPPEQRGHSLTVYRKKITESDLASPNVSFRTVG